METPRDAEQNEPVEENPEEPGAEGGAGTDDAESLPGAPSEDDSEAGDTDQHSGA